MEGWGGARAQGALLHALLPLHGAANLAAPGEPPWHGDLVLPGGGPFLAWGISPPFPLFPPGGGGPFLAQRGAEAAALPSPPPS